MERLGLGPDELLKDNPKLVYGRVTGWGQDGPLAQEAGHDINYVALTRAAARHRPEGAAGGADQLSRRLCRRRDDAGVRHGRGAAGGAARAAKGQVIDAAMSDGAALIGALTYGLRAAGHVARRAGGEPARRRRRRPTASIAARTASSSRSARSSRSSARRCSRDWRCDPGASREEIATVIKSRTRDEWAAHFAGTDACVAPVLDLGEAPVHPHNIARRTFLDLDGVFQPAPAPRYSAMHARPARPAAARGRGRRGDPRRARLFARTKSRDCERDGVLL